MHGVTKEADGGMSGWHLELEKLQAENERLKTAEKQRLTDPCGHCACTEICENKNKELRAENKRLRTAIESAWGDLTLALAGEDGAWAEHALETLGKALEVRK